MHGFSEGVSYEVRLLLIAEEPDCVLRVGVSQGCNRLLNGFILEMLRRAGYEYLTGNHLLYEI